MSVLQFKPRGAKGPPAQQVVPRAEVLDLFSRVVRHEGFSPTLRGLDRLEFITRMSQLLDGLGYIKPESIVIRQQMLAGSSTDELLRFAQESDENNWRAHPAYYRALVNELIRRKEV